MRDKRLFLGSIAEEYLKAKPDYALHVPIYMETPVIRLRFEHGRLDDLKTLHPAYFALV